MAFFDRNEAVGSGGLGTKLSLPGLAGFGVVGGGAGGVGGGGGPCTGDGGRGGRRRRRSGGSVGRRGLPRRRSPRAATLGPIARVFRRDERGRARRGGRTGGGPCALR